MGMESEEDRVLRLQEVSRLVGLSVDWLRALRRSGKFVPEIRIGKRAVGFKRSDVLAWIESKKAA